MRNIFWEIERRLLLRSKYLKPVDPRRDGPQPVTIVTGGSEGIGLALANACAELGHNLLLIARTKKNLQIAAENIENHFGVKVHSLSIDLAREEASADIAAYLKKTNLSPRLLVNNVGIGLSGPFIDQQTDELQRLVDVNISSWTTLTHLLLPEIQNHDAGGIINISSVAGMLPGPYQAAYYASKAYMNSLTEALAHELKFSPVRVAAVCPGPVATNFHEKMGAKRSVYLYTQYVVSPKTVARSTLIWFALSRRMIVPGALNFLNSLFIRIIPNSLLLWIMGFLLKRRGIEGKK